MSQSHQTWWFPFETTFAELHIHQKCLFSSNHKLQTAAQKNFIVMTMTSAVVTYWLVGVPNPLALPQASEAGTCLPIDQNANDQLFASVSIPRITMCSVFSCFPLSEKGKKRTRGGVWKVFWDFFLWQTPLIGTFQFVFHFTGTF